MKINYSYSLVLGCPRARTTFGTYKRRDSKEIEVAEKVAKTELEFYEY